MRHLLNTFAFTALVFTLFVAGVQADDDDNERNGPKSVLYGNLVDQLIVGEVRFEVPGGYPIPPVDISTLLDANHGKAILSGLYTQESVDAQFERCARLYNYTYGFDWKAAVKNPFLGSYDLPYATLYPFFRQAAPTDRVTFNSDKVKPKEVGSQTASEFGWLMITKPVPGGSFGGLVYDATFSGGQIAGCTQYNFLEVLRNGTVSNTVGRVTYDGFQLYPSVQVPNNYGGLVTAGLVELFDGPVRRGQLRDLTTRTFGVFGNLNATTGLPEYRRNWVFQVNAEFIFYK